MDVSSIENEVLKYFAALIGLVIVWGLQRAIAWLGLKLNAERQAQLSSAIDKMLTFGVTKAEQIIAEKGWDHIDSKNAVMNVALDALLARFPETIENAGLDPSPSPMNADRARLLMQMQRMIPDVFARAAASPATPPTLEQQAAVMVASTTPVVVRPASIGASL